MPDTANSVIDALRAGDDELSPLVRDMTPEQLTAPSAAADWDVSQVLSHLGSGAVITLATFDAALGGRPTPGMEANQEVWKLWDAMTPQERADGYLAANADLLARYDSVDPQTREDLRVDMGFLPAPVDLGTAARFRLNEFALHSWDVRVVRDPNATVHPDATPLLLDQVELMLGWLAKTAALEEREVTVAVILDEPQRSFGLRLADSPGLVGPPTGADATLVAPAEAWLRLVAGRLAAKHTPPGVTVSGDITLDTLRQVFPGY